MAAWEWLDSQVDSLVAFEIVVAVEALWTLVALERTIIVRALLLVVHVVAHVGSVTTVVSWHHAVLVHAAANQRKVTIGVVDVGENRSLAV